MKLSWKDFAFIVVLSLPSIGVHLHTTAALFQVAEEGSTVSCVVERTRGALGYVYVSYTISQIEANGVAYLVDDFANASGTITFHPWQRSEVNLATLVS